jgi:hypothetical protein
MSDLKPRGTKICINGVERYILFDLNVIDDIQSHYNMPVDEVLNLLTDDDQSFMVLRYLLTVLLNDESERAEFERADTIPGIVTEREVGLLISLDNFTEIMLRIFQAYGFSLPELDEFENPNVKSEQPH